MLMPDPTPLISCLLVTAPERMHHVKRSVQCFVDQTYPNKELVVVNEGPPEYQREMDTWFAEQNFSNIRTVWLNGYYSLGALRNISIGMCQGEIYCQWDDDDFCMPQRLSVQYAHLNRERAKACFFTDQLHYYFPSKELYWDNWGRYHSGGQLLHSIIPGTAMIRREVEVRYPSVGVNASAGEDSVFVEKLLAKHHDQIALVKEHGYIHVYTYHGKQVYDLQHHLNISKARAQPREEIIKRSHEIKDLIDYLGLDDNVKVMCRDGLVFVHRRQVGT
jgi:glycosyltransferase involved in cell wall biosynthesis